MHLILLQSCGSTSYHTDDEWSGAGIVSQTPQPDEPFLCQLEDLDSRKQDRLTEITRMREELRGEIWADFETRDR